MTVLIITLLAHFISDFILQSREMGQKKSTKFKYLSKHMQIIWFVMFPLLTPSLGFVNSFIFTTLNVIIHGIIDWNIWKLYKYSVYKRLLKLRQDQDALDSSVWPGFQSQAHHDMATLGKPDDKKFAELAGVSWQYWNDHLFYTTIGFDQLLHIVTIVLLLEIIK